MLVYGDHTETVGTREQVARIQGELDRVTWLPVGIARHAYLVEALIETGRLLQGVADAGAASRELDNFLYQLAQAFVRSLESHFAEIGALPELPELDLPVHVDLRQPEGFAFYAVYPEAYVAAARELTLSGPPRVIGIRSIGTTLGAVVAAALDAPPAATVRPVGDPFARTVELPPQILQAEAHYVVVDEGPGLSGSSFGAVADWLQDHGVPLERIAFVASHGGDLGPQASPAHQHRWGRAQRVAARFEPSFLERDFGPLARFSTGSSGERLKYIGSRKGQRVLLKFSGSGAIAGRKLDMARSLHAAGFTPEPLGLLHGFLVERWREDGRPLKCNDVPVEEIGRYIGARARLFPAPDASGATIEQLLEMCRRNIAVGLGEMSAAALDCWDPARLQARVCRVRTDNKLDREEWLRLGGGRLLKTDALDHHQAHDLIGCQDAAWDLAGAAIEFDLKLQATERLIVATGLVVDAKLLAFYLQAYCAFRMGHAALAGDQRRSERYAERLQVLLHQHYRLGTRHESLVD